jgi:putative FmdB family regulatory protein
MPTYEYACKECGHEFEIVQSMKDGPLRKCPKCKKAALQRLISGGAGLIFKGTGFYETDYKRTATSTAEPKTEKKTETKAEPAKTEKTKPVAASAKD